MAGLLKVARSLSTTRMFPKHLLKYLFKYLSQHVYICLSIFRDLGTI